MSIQTRRIDAIVEYLHFPQRSYSIVSGEYPSGSSRVFTFWQKFLMRVVYNGTFDGPEYQILYSSIMFDDKIVYSVR